MSIHAEPETLLHTWFGPPSRPPLEAAKRWFSKDEAFDRSLRTDFEAVLEAGIRGELAVWESTPRGRLALIVLFDQISRNIFRGTPRSFAQDPLALAQTLEALAKGEDRLLTPVERYFVLMPLMHAEDVAQQRKCVAEFEQLLSETPAPKETHDLVVNALDYARRHAVIVERFGRFPHRNAILGRESTPEEKEFLTQPGSSF
jgi:uncharacterized protein (DUF924 family)